MKFLGIDTTRKKAIIYIYDDEKNRKLVTIMDDKIKHSEGIFLYLEKALFDSRLTLYDFDILSAVVGPGSFTGIRVGMSMIKGFGKVTNKTIIPINTFEILKRVYKNHVILLSSTNSTCYFGRIKHAEIIETGVIEKIKITDTFANDILVVLKEEYENMGLRLNNVVEIDDISEYYFDAIKSKIEKNDCEKFEPYYLQLSQAERECKNAKL